MSLALPSETVKVAVWAVVAEEVRGLAKRSAEAARETASKIEDSICKSRRGVEMSNQVARNFSEISDKVRQLDELMAALQQVSATALAA